MRKKRIELNSIPYLARIGPADRVLLVVISLALVRGILYALISPPLSGPDEKGHYDYLASLYQSGGSLVEGKESKQPPLYYWLSLPFFAAFGGHDSMLSVYALRADQLSLLSMFAARVFGVLMTVATVPIAYWTTRAVLPDSRFVCLGVAAFVALVPQYGWQGASINNDNLAKLLASCMILLMVQGLSLGFSPKRSLALLLLAIAGLATKPTTLPIVAMIPVAFTFKVLSTRVTRAKLLYASIPALCLTPLFLVGLGQSGALGSVEKLLGKWIVPGIFSIERLLAFARNLDVWPFVYQFKTFWGSFSTDSILLPSLAYWGCAGFIGVSIAGLLFRTLPTKGARTAGSDSGEDRQGRSAQIATMGLLLASQWLLSFGRFYASDPLRPDQRIVGWEDDFALMQGRFLFPVIIPIAFLVMWGLEGMLTLPRAKRVTWLIVAFLVAVDWVALATLAYGGHSWRAYFE